MRLYLRKDESIAVKGTGNDEIILIKNTGNGLEIKGEIEDRQE